jgi:hypothetical protein
MCIAVLFNGTLFRKIDLSSVLVANERPDLVMCAVPGHKPPFDGVLPQQPPQLPSVLHNSGKTFLHREEISHQNLVQCS